MTSPRFDALAARLLEREEGAEPEPPPREARSDAIRMIEQAMRRKARRRFAARATLAAAATALLAVGAAELFGRGGARLAAVVPSMPAAAKVTVVGHPTGAGATVQETGSSSPLTDGRFLAPGSRIRADANGHVVLALSTGTRLTVEEQSDVSIDDNGPVEVFSLRSGALRADVAKLHAGQRFLIRTPDSEVEVRGTSFRVATAEASSSCGGGTVTRVNVYEGVVSVRHAGEEARVGAGEEWPSDCVAKAEPPATRPLPAHPAATTAAKPGAAPPPASSAEPELASDLREQNDAFGRALAAKRSGATAEAVQAFEAFVARYPTSSLVENALVQRMRLLRSVDPARAARAAEQYLARFPKGFARTEAEQLEHAGR